MPVQSALHPSRFTAAVLAGGAAIILNTLALNAADVFHLETAHGGLLRLLSSWLAIPFDRIGLVAVWSFINGPAPTRPAFQIGFHVFVGLLMALVYGVVLERLLPRGAIIKGLIYAAIVWIINAAMILPATGEGFAGRAHLTLAGMAWFAACHTLFFLLLAYGFAALTRDRASAGGPVRRSVVNTTDQDARQ